MKFKVLPFVVLMCISSLECMEQNDNAPLSPSKKRRMRRDSLLEKSCYNEALAGYIKLSFYHKPYQPTQVPLEYWFLTELTSEEVEHELSYYEVFAGYRKKFFSKVKQ